MPSLTRRGRWGSGDRWLHVTALTGLWPFTSWGRDQLDCKLETMSSALAASLQDRCPAGIVLTSAAGLAPEGTPEEVVRSEAGIALRTAAPPLRARESLILPFSEPSHRGEDWLALRTRRVTAGLAGRLPGRGCRTSPRCSAFRRADAGKLQIC